MFQSFRHPVAASAPTPRVRPLPFSKEDMQALRDHQEEARAEFSGLLRKARARGRAFLEKAEAEGVSPRTVKIQLGRQMEDLAATFLLRYVGTVEMDPMAKGMREKVLKTLLRSVMEGLSSTDAWEKVLPAVTKGFEITQLAENQELLRKSIPEDIRRYLPRNLVVKVDRDGNIREMTDRFVNELETIKIKGERQKDLLLRYNEMVKAVRKDLRSKDARTHLSAIIMAIVMETGIRPGQERNRVLQGVAGEQIEVETFGATTLTSEHVRFVKGNVAYLEFVGKGGTLNRAKVTDKQVVQALRQYVDEAQKSTSGQDSSPDYLFVMADGKRFNYGMLRRYFKQKAEFQGLKITDFRKLKATRTVLRQLRDAQQSLYERIREFADQGVDNLREHVAQEVQAVVEQAFLNAQAALSHTNVETTVKNYVNPAVLLDFLSHGRAADTLEDVVLNGKSKLVLDIDKFVAQALKEKAAGTQVSLADLLEEIEGNLAGEASTERVLQMKAAGLKAEMRSFAPEVKEEALLLSHEGDPEAPILSLLAKALENGDPANAKRWLHKLSDRFRRPGGLPQGLIPAVVGGFRYASSL